MPDMKLLLIDESLLSKDKIKPELESWGYTVDHAESYESLQNILLKNVRYDVVVVERDLPRLESDEPEQIGMVVADEMGKKFPLAKIVFFDSGGHDGDESTDQIVFKIISKSQSVQLIVQEIQRVGWSAVEHQLRVAHNQLQQISEITTALVAEQSSKKVYETIVSGVAALGFDRVRLYLLREDDSLRGVAQCGLSKEIAKADKFFKKPWASHFLNLPREAQGQHKPQIFRKAGDHNLEDYETRVGRCGLEEWVIVPLSIGDHTMGKLSADNLHSGRKIFDDELPALMGLASQAAVAIDSLKAKEKEAWKTRQLEVIHEVATKISKLTTFTDVSQAVSRAVVDLFDTVDHSGLVLLIPEGSNTPPFTAKAFFKLGRRYPVACGGVIHLIPTFVLAKWLVNSHHEWDQLAKNCRLRGYRLKINC